MKKPNYANVQKQLVMGKMKINKSTSKWYNVEPKQ